jgi:hypothetical protein
MTTMLQNAWRLGDRPELGAMSTANTLIRSLDASTPGALPDLRAATTIFIGSDYGGQHATSKYESYALYLQTLNARKAGSTHAIRFENCFSRMAVDFHTNRYETGDVQRCYRNSCAPLILFMVWS